MSLYKQLWIAVVLLLTVVFGFSFAVTTLSAKAYLEQQLSIKNSDNAAALALSLSQQGADPVLLELTLSAQFDTGFYEFIELVDPEGKTVVRRTHDREVNGAPDWFVALFPIAAEAGTANVQAGWQQAGTLTLRSHSRFAYAELWRGTVKQAAVFLLAAMIAGFLGNRLLRGILSPLAAVVEQAQALEQRRYITIEEPATVEFKQLVGAMNSLSGHTKTMLSQESKRLQKWQRDAHTDTVTGLRNREPFLKELSAMLAGDDADASGCLCIVRLTKLARLNQVYGRNTIDALLLRDVGRALNRLAMDQSSWSACRLNGSEFAVIAPREMEATDFGNAVQKVLADCVERNGMGGECRVLGAVTGYSSHDSMSDLFTRLDGALLSAEQEKSATVSVAYKGDISIKPIREQLQEWRGILERALEDNLFSLLQYPVLDTDGAIIHYEAPASIDWQDKTLRAGQFVPWVSRLQMSLNLDTRVVELALETISRDGNPVAVNLTEAALSEQSFIGWLEQALTSNNEAAQKLWLEIPEAAVFRHLDQFKRLCARAQHRGTHVGIEHVGHQLAEIGQLHDVGLDYLKIDASFVSDVQDSPGNQTLLAALSTLGHSIGVTVIAEGVQSEAEWESLKGLGVDGATGPGIREAS